MKIKKLAIVAAILMGASAHAAALKRKRMNPDDEIAAQSIEAPKPRRAQQNPPKRKKSDLQKEQLIALFEHDRETDESVAQAKTILAKHKSWADHADDQGVTLAMQATKNRAHRLLKVLFQAGVDLSAVDDDGDSIMHWGARHATRNMVEDIVIAVAKTADLKKMVNQANKAGDTPVHCAAAQRVCEPNITLLLCGRIKDIEITEEGKELPEKWTGADLNAANRQGLKPIDCALDASVKRARLAMEKEHARSRAALLQVGCQTVIAPELVKCLDPQLWQQCRQIYKAVADLKKAGNKKSGHELAVECAKNKDPRIMCAINPVQFMGLQDAWAKTPYWE